jgi:hypothetical protein
VTDQPTMTTQPPAAPPAKSRMTRIVSIVAGLVVVVFGGIKLINIFVLPGCDSSNIQDTVREIFKATPLVTYTGITTVSDDKSGKMCGAHIETAEEKADIRYSVTWNGWSPYVKIENVDKIAPPAKPDASSPDAIPPPEGTPTPNPAPAQ